MNSSDISGVLVAPPAYFVVFLGLAFAADRLYPAPFVQFNWSAQVGYMIVGLSFLWLWLVEHEFSKHKTSSNCSKSATVLIMTGPFTYSRNPAYVGFTVMIAGFSFVVNSLWLLASTVPACLAVFWFVIRKEEAYLERKFGNDYVEYRDRVRRWI